MRQLTFDLAKKSQECHDLEAELREVCEATVEAPRKEPESCPQCPRTKSCLLEEQSRNEALEEEVTTLRGALRRLQQAADGLEADLQAAQWAGEQTSQGRSGRLGMTSRQ